MQVVLCTIQTRWREWDAFDIKFIIFSKKRRRTRFMPPKKTPLWKEVDRQYMKSNANWQKPSLAFRVTSDRFKPTHKDMTVDCFGKYEVPGTFAPKAGSANARSTWAKSTQEQRPAVKAKTDLVYSVPDPKPRSLASSSLASRQVRPCMAPQPGVAKGQESFPEPETWSKKAQSTNLAFRSNLPQQAPTRKPIDLSYNPPQGSMAAQCRSASGHTAWTKNNAPQRPKPSAGVDLTYKLQLSQLSSGKYSGCSAMSSRTPKIAPHPEPQAPPVGLYTSPYIACGMQS